MSTSRCFATTLLGLAFFVAKPVLPALPSSARQVVDYAISVRLDAEKKEIQGSETVTWRNPSTDSVDDLWFHLYWNAFRNNRSTFYVESGGKLRSDSAPEDGWGWVDLSELQLADGTDLLPALTFEHPDDDNGDDRTVARVRLPRPVMPGEELVLSAKFSARIPKVYARAGYMGDFFAITQWFPKLGVYEPAGMRQRKTGGWNCHQYHANSEYYADFGHYRVEITVPSEFVVGATGPRIGTAVNADGTTTYIHEQGEVHDFAWTADPTFVEIVETFDADREVSADELATTARLLDRTPDEIRLRNVQIRLLMQPSHRPQVARHLHATRLALKWFGLWYGAYPYPTITIVDPPGDVGGASGVEYPTLFFAGTSYAGNFWPFSRIREVEVVTVHEFGHQYWYGLVGSNEFEEAWLDEGFNTYSTGKVLDLGYGAGRSIVDLFGLELGAAEANRLGNNSNRRFDSIATPAWKFSDRQYSFNAYSRPALVLETLEGMLGEETMARIMRTYHESYRFGHPSGEDFMAVAEEVSGRDLDPYFDQVVRGPGVFDPAVTRLESRRMREFRGRIEMTPATGETQESPASAIVSERQARAREQELDADGSRLWHSEVELRQLGEVHLPVEVELNFENREPEHRTWSGVPRRELWTFERAERLLSVRLDPDDKLALDSDRWNNARRTFEDKRASRRWSVRLYGWIARGIAATGL